MAYSTKDELQALEADLKLLALSNKDLSHSKKTLTDTIAAISRASVNPVVPKETASLAAPPVIDSQGVVSKAIPFTSLIAMPSVSLPPIVPRKENSSDRMTEQLQRCMESVQELALTISCALNTLQGHVKTGSSDIHGSYVKLNTAMAQLPIHIQCNQCKHSVAWSHLEPARHGIGQSGACECGSQTPPQLKDSHGVLTGTLACDGGYDFGVMDAESMMMAHDWEHSLIGASQNEVRHELDKTAGARLYGIRNDATILPKSQIFPCWNARRYRSVWWFAAATSTRSASRC